MGALGAGIQQQDMRAFMTERQGAIEWLAGQKLDNFSLPGSE